MYDFAICGVNVEKGIVQMGQLVVGEVYGSTFFGVDGPIGVVESRQILFHTEKMVYGLPERKKERKKHSVK